MRILFWLLLPFVAVLVALFAVSNREAVDLGLWPLSNAVQLPLYLVVLLALFGGCLFGAVAAWVAGRHWRREVRRRGRRIEALERELAASHAELHSSAAPRELSAPRGVPVRV